MQRRWEEQLAGYVAASFQVISLGNTASQSRAARQQAGHCRNALFRRQAGDRRRPHRRRARRIQHAGRPGQRAGVAACANVAGLSPGPPLGRAAGRHPQYRGGADLQSGARRAAGDPRRRHLRARDASAIASMPPRCCTTSLLPCPPGRWWASSVRPAPARARSPSSFSASTCPESGRVLVDGVDLAMVDIVVAAAPDRRGAAGERAVQPVGARQHRARRSGRCRWSA